MGIPETRTPKIDAILSTPELPKIPSRKGSPAWLGSGWKDATTLCRNLWQDPSDPDSTLGAVVYRALSL